MYGHACRVMLDKRFQESTEQVTDQNLLSKNDNGSIQKEGAVGEETEQCLLDSSSADESPDEEYESATSDESDADKIDSVDRNSEMNKLCVLEERDNPKLKLGMKVELRRFMRIGKLVKL